MADRGIIFSAAMVRALLAGRKTQTRRLLKPQPEWLEKDGIVSAGWSWGGFHAWSDDRRFGEAISEHAPTSAGDRLYVRESCRAEELSSGEDGVRFLADETWLAIDNTPEAADQWLKLLHYGGKRANIPLDGKGQSVPSIHMPRWASRMTLLVSEVRIQRLQAIDDIDAEHEGISFDARKHTWTHGADDTRLFQSPRDAFADLWGLLHTDDGTTWSDNPWVIATTFKVEKQNIDGLS